MNDRAYSFLEGVLGADGATAFKKAIEQEKKLANAVVPRAILSWIDLASRYNYEGSLPGVENTYIQFKKSEGVAFDGAVSVGDDVYTFRQASRYHVAGAVAVMLGLNAVDLDQKVRDVTLQRLGKSIDTLVKARIAIDELGKKVLDPNLGVTFTHQHHDLGGVGNLTHIKAIHPSGQVVGEAVFEHQQDGSLKPADVSVQPEHQRLGVASAIYAHAQKITGKTIQPSTAQTAAGQGLWAGNAKQQQFGTAKTELPGQANKPKEQQEAVAPAAPQFQAQQVRPPKPSMKITKAESERKCSMCQRSQFKSGKFAGCLCFMDMSKSVRTVANDNGFVLEFRGNEWDADALAALRAALRGG